MNILKKIGIWKNINSKEISPVKEARILDGDSSKYLHFDHTKTVENSLGYLVPNHVIRKAIYEKLQNLKTIKIFANNEVLKIEPNKSLSKVYLKNRKILERAAITCPVGKSLHEDIKQEIIFKYSE